MLGLEYYRIVNGYRKADIAKRLGISDSSVAKMERDRRFSRPKIYYRILCELYGVSIDELISEKPDIPKKNVTKATTQAQTPVARFMRANFYTMRTLGDELGISRQMVYNICNLEEPAAKYIEKLAELEGITVEEFKKKYENQTDSFARE